MEMLHEQTVNFRENLAALCAGYGQVQRLADEAKLSRVYLSRLIHGHCVPSLDVAARIATRVDPLRAFFAAEDYHQDYLLTHPTQPYIAIHDLPKVRNFQRLLPALYVEKPVTVRGSKVANRQSRPAVPAGGGAMMMAAAEQPEGGGAMMSAQGASGASKTEGPLPPLTGATGWLNSKPLSPESLRGKVVAVDFWAYSCINCLRAMPYVNAWYRHYKNSGLVVLGVHSPEFAFEKDITNVRAAVEKFDLQYPMISSPIGWRFRRRIGIG
jgi:thiol-disulfide isomerase/thioredoxin/transcriptional regulator with XRE-family HTH domain